MEIDGVIDFNYNKIQVYFNEPFSRPEFYRMQNPKQIKQVKKALLYLKICTSSISANISGCVYIVKTA